VNQPRVVEECSLSGFPRVDKSDLEEFYARYGDSYGSTCGVQIAIDFTF
jgi:hypothetical protein